MSFVTSAPFALAAGGLQAFSAVREGQTQKAASDARAAELKRESDLAGIAANQSQAEHLLELGRTIGNMRATIAARGLDPLSPSAAAIEGGIERIADTNIQRTAFNARQQMSNTSLAAAAARMSGNAALTAGYIKGAGSFFKAVTEANSAYGGGSATYGDGVWTPGPQGFPG